jgi:taurine--2-oxoglutarate transaminase
MSEKIRDFLFEKQKKYVFFPWSAQNAARPAHIAQAKGCELTYFDGRSALDFNSHVFNAAIGHGHPAIRETFAEYAANPVVTHPSLIHEEKAKLGENLARITPGEPFKGLVKSFLCLSGAEANENAIKIARLITGRYKIITRFRSYHGATLATLGASGDYRRIPFDGATNGVIRIPDPYPRGSGQHIDTVRLLEEQIEIEGPETIACVLLEGITGANGVFVPPADYWPRIREICSRNGIMLIADEVFSGFGRTGKWFGVDHYGITPDIMTLAKGITGGYGPMGAVVVNETIANYFENETLWCGLTNYGHPLLCALANTTIAVIELEGLIENARVRGLEMKEQLKELESGNDLVAEVRSIGLLTAIDLRKGRDDDRPYVAYRAKGEDAKKVARLQKRFTDAGLICTVRFGTILLVPPLCVTAEQVRKAVGIVGDVLGEEAKGA